MSEGRVLSEEEITEHEEFHLGLDVFDTERNLIATIRDRDMTIAERDKCVAGFIELSNHNAKIELERLMRIRELEGQNTIMREATQDAYGLIQNVADWANVADAKEVLSDALAKIGGTQDDGKRETT